jgi:hypothetical protein
MKEKFKMKLSTRTIKNLCLIPFVLLMPIFGGIACTAEEAAIATADTLAVVGEGITDLSTNLKEAGPYFKDDLQAIWYDMTGTIEPYHSTIDPVNTPEALAQAQDTRDKLISGANWSDLVMNAANQITSEDYKQINDGDYGALNGILPFEINVDSVGEDLAAVLNSLDIGQVSAILQSEIGYHLIQLLDEHGGQIRIGHVVFQVEPTLDEPAPEQEEVVAEADPLEEALNRLASLLGQ